MSEDSSGVIYIVRAIRGDKCNSQKNRNFNQIAYDSNALRSKVFGIIETIVNNNAGEHAAGNARKNWWNKHVKQNRTICE